MLYPILISLMMMALFGALLGAVIGVLARVFRIESDARVELVAELLPNANCGGCGKAGCVDFAKAVVAGELPPGGCPVSSRETVSAIARALGIEAGEVESKVAVVLCSGDDASTRKKVRYNGVNDCVSASLVAGGPKNCAYGCLGFSSCARACPFGAIEMVNSLAVVHRELCVGCGKCVETCPRHLIKLVPLRAKINVYCSSPAKGVEKKAYCAGGCIGCRKCGKAAEGKFVFNGFCASVDYDAAELPGEDVLEKANCPSGCLRSFDGHLKKEYSEREGA